MKLMMILVTAILTVGLTVAANLLLKRGASEPTSPALLGLIGWRTLGGFAAFGFALIAYTILLKYVDLHFAASLTSAKFICVVLAAWMVLGERINGQQWIGMGLIAIGILVVSLTARGTDTKPDSQAMEMSTEAP
ncbi:MAG: EamA family transporter [Phycisphaerales bacterium]|nr:EamA family transporter [Phycisphaerales bacterium]